MNEKKDRDSDKRDRRDDDSFEDALEDLGKSMARFMQKAFEKSEEIFSNSGLDDLFSNVDFPDGGSSTGTRHKKQAQPQKETQREPQVDIFDEGDEVVIYVELPGVDEDTLEVKHEDGTITIKANSGRDRFEKTIEVPSGTTSTPNYHFKNGILKIELKKKKKTAKSASSSKGKSSSAKSSNSSTKSSGSKKKS